MERFNFDAAATLAKIREAQGAPIFPIVPTVVRFAATSVGTIGTVGSPSAGEKARDAEIIDAAERFQRRGGVHD